MLYECHQLCDACYNCLIGQRYGCKWDDEKKCSVYEIPDDKEKEGV